MILKISQYDLLQIPVKQGQKYYASDIRCLYIDNGTDIQNRTRFNALVLNTDYERLYTLRPENGRNYYVIETNSLWVYDTKWVLKDGDIRQYNAYGYSNNGMTPVVNIDEHITSNITGDKIIDNNGLLGNGTVVVRDYNRIVKGAISIDFPSYNIAFNSYLDRGFSFYPYSLTADREERTRVGSFHLDVDSKVVGSGASQSVERKGKAIYYGDLTVYGDVYVAKPLDPITYNTQYVPTGSQQMTHKFNCSANVTTPDNITYTVFTRFIIDVLSATSSKVRITRWDDRNGVVVTDSYGNPVFDGALQVGSDITYDATRSQISTGVKYTLQSNNLIITLGLDSQDALVTLSDASYFNSGDYISAVTQVVNRVKLNS